MNKFFSALVYENKITSCFILHTRRSEEEKITVMRGSYQSAFAALKYDVYLFDIS